jgi:hypothetical protein
MMALNASYTKVSVKIPPISHLSSNEMKILNGRDSEYSPEGEIISSWVEELNFILKVNFANQTFKVELSSSRAFSFKYAI